jgi:hypothetical protein
MVLDFVRQKFRQSKDYQGDSLLRDLIEAFSEVAKYLKGVDAAGDWTPELRFGGNGVGITYSTQVGKYIQIGKFVHLAFELTLTAKGSSVGGMSIINQPVTTTGGGNNGAGGLSLWTALTGLNGTPIASCAGSIIVVRQPIAGGTGYVDLNDTNFTNTSRLRGVCSFIAP